MTRWRRSPVADLVPEILFRMGDMDGTPVEIRAEQVRSNRWAARLLVDPEEGWAPGAAWLTPDQMEALAAGLAESADELRRRGGERG
jgi:hypothetical protein